LTRLTMGCRPDCRTVSKGSLVQRRPCLRGTEGGISSFPVPFVPRSYGQASRSRFAELLMDCEENQVLRAVLVGMLRDMERR
jgi:hypothetical protein